MRGRQKSQFRAPQLSWFQSLGKCGARCWWSVCMMDGGCCSEWSDVNWTVSRRGLLHKSTSGTAVLSRRPRPSLPPSNEPVLIWTKTCRLIPTTPSHSHSLSLCSYPHRIQSLVSIPSAGTAFPPTHPLTSHKNAFTPLSPNTNCNSQPTTQVLFLRALFILHSPLEQKLKIRVLIAFAVIIEIRHHVLLGTHLNKFKLDLLRI